MDKNFRPSGWPKIFLTIRMVRKIKDLTIRMVKNFLYHTDGQKILDHPYGQKNKRFDHTYGQKKFFSICMDKIILSIRMV